MNNTSLEEWRKIPSSFDSTIDLSSFYEVSNIGGVRSIDGKNSNVFINDSGYAVVHLCVLGWRKTFKVHRLVAAAFIENPDNKPEINHINANKSDNRVANLEWVTGEENKIHCSKHGLYHYGASHYASKLTASAVRGIREKRALGIKRQILADEYGVSIDTIKAVLARHTWRHVT